MSIITNLLKKQRFWVFSYTERPTHLRVFYYFEHDEQKLVSSFDFVVSFRGFSAKTSHELATHAGIFQKICSPKKSVAVELIHEEKSFYQEPHFC